MDSYNRGYESGLFDDGATDADGLGESGRIGSARIVNPLSIGRDEGVLAEWRAAGFYAIAYSLEGGETVIAYRGTNDAVDHTQGWSVGAGMIGWNQQA
jgi:hypothetical protein